MTNILVVRRLTAASFFLAVLGLATPGLNAASSAGGSYTGGKNYEGFGFKGRLDLDPKGTWEANASFAHVQSTGTSISESNEISGGLDYSLNDSWAFHGSLTGWKDKINFIHYFGPTFGVTFNWNRSVPEQGARLKSSQPDGSDTPDHLENESPDNILSVTLSVDYFAYGTDVQTSSRTVTIHQKNRRERLVIPPQQTQVTVDQIHPSIEIEKPLFDANVTPYISAGVYRYSKDPSLIEALAGRPRFSAQAGRLNSLVGGFQKKSWEVGTEIDFPGDINLHGSFGKSQSATDLTWSKVGDIDLSHTFIDCLKIRAEWNRAIQNSESLTLWTGEATYLF